MKIIYFWGEDVDGNYIEIKYNKNTIELWTSTNSYVMDVPDTIKYIGLKSNIK